MNQIFFGIFREVQKNALLKHLGGKGEGQADDHIWEIVQETTPQDFYL